MSKKNSSVPSLNNIVLKDKKISKIYQLFKKKISFLKKKKIIIGVSGGPDSLALAALSRVYEYEFKTKIFYVLIDHGIRKGSSKEALNVKKLLKKNSINLNILTNKVKINSNIQRNARDIRYKLLVNFCKRKKLNHILTAHHSDDQIETFLIRLSRGSGVQGLSSMKFLTKLDKQINLIRPLLDVKKENLIYTAKKVFKKVIKDPSNKDIKFLRVRIRSLKNKLEKSGISHEQIIKSIKNLSATSETLNKYMNKIYKKNVKKKKNEAIVNFKKLKEESLEIQIRILSLVIKNFTGSYYPPRSKKIINLIEGINNKKQKKFTLSKCVIEAKQNQLSIKKEA